MTFIRGPQNKEKKKGKGPKYTRIILSLNLSSLQ